VSTAAARRQVLRQPQAAYVAGMKIVLTVLVAISMAATLGVLFAGMLGLVRGGGDPRRSNALMRWRVVLQGVTLLLFALLLSLLRS
jgi:hypothetical protein